MSLKFATTREVIRSILSNARLLKADPRLVFFLARYMQKFKIIKVGHHLIIHSHLPPLNHPGYARFIDEHLLARVSGPSHAQIGVTNACPQNCLYCYNKNRRGQCLESDTIIRLIRDLKRMGIFWLGFTGGEPLLNKDLARIIESAGPDCVTKLFTTGCTLTPQMVTDFNNAGLMYVSISLDHWQEVEHDRVRQYPGAFKHALKAIDMFKRAQDIHVGVSAVISREMIQREQVEPFLQFLIGLDIHEVWLSETKPSVHSYWCEEQILSESERLALCRLQDRYNREGKIVINYLGHFEGKEHFGCNAGHKMVYIDAFGEVSPCVFTPMSFGNVREWDLETIFLEMKRYFPSQGTCFINKNYKLFQDFQVEEAPLGVTDSVSMMKKVRFGPFAKFMRYYYL